MLLSVLLHIAGRCWERTGGRWTGTGLVGRARRPPGSIERLNGVNFGIIVGKIHRGKRALAIGAVHIRHYADRDRGRLLLLQISVDDS